MNKRINYALIQLGRLSKLGRDQAADLDSEQVGGRRKVDVRLPGKGNSDSHGARPVHLIITDSILNRWEDDDVDSPDKDKDKSAGRAFAVPAVVGPPPERERESERKRERE